MINPQKLLVSLIERKSADGKSKFIYLADTIAEEIDIIEDAIKYSQEWVGLTDEDRQELAAEQHSWDGLCSAVEAKLKEKNT